MPPDPDADAVPAGVGVAAYRIVQEALSNAGRHAPGAAISIAVEVEPAGRKNDPRTDAD